MTTKEEIWIPFDVIESFMVKVLKKAGLAGRRCKNCDGCAHAGRQTWV
jgi:hypothetical protein